MIITYLYKYVQINIMNSHSYVVTKLEYKVGQLPIWDILLHHKKLRFRQKHNTYLWSGKIYEGHFLYFYSVGDMSKSIITISKRQNVLYFHHQRGAELFPVGRHNFILFIAQFIPKTCCKF